MMELWAEPGPARDLFWGVGGRDPAPDPDGVFRFVARDTTGKSPGYDVRDAQGRLWSVKLGLEAQSEVDNVDDFERERFIHSVRDGHVRFHYRGAWREPHLKRGVTPADVRWISERLARLTAEQWDDAFRAAGYTETEAAQYVVRLRQKVTEGLNVLVASSMGA